MDTTVNLQPPFEYSWWVITAAVIITLLALILLIYAIRKIRYAQKNRKKSAIRNIAKFPPYAYHVKNKYIARIQNLLGNYSSGKITMRDAYQNLSIVIRGFVHEVTGLNVEYCTANEVKALGLKWLDVLMEEYYVPEFAEDERAKGKNFEISCKTAMGVIRTWR